MLILARKHSRRCEVRARMDIWRPCCAAGPSCALLETSLFSHSVQLAWQSLPGKHRGGCPAGARMSTADQLQGMAEHYQRQLAAVQAGAPAPAASWPPVQPRSSWPGGSAAADWPPGACEARSLAGSGFQMLAAGRVALLVAQS